MYNMLKKGVSKSDTPLLIIGIISSAAGKYSFRNPRPRQTWCRSPENQIPGAAFQVLRSAIRTYCRVPVRQLLLIQQPQTDRLILLKYTAATYWQ